MLARRYNADHINLGFSGSARGEDAMADYISGLDMSVFIYDYDHNAPNLEHYEATHERFFKKIRESHPSVPIVMATRPKAELSEEEISRVEIAKRTYENAKAGGDENVYFIDGRDLTDLVGCDGLVDGTHPNDMGFYNMTVGFAKVLDNILK